MTVVEEAVTLMVLAVVVIRGAALAADLIGEETVVGLIKVTKMTGPNRLHQVNEWNSKCSHIIFYSL